ncbi:NAD-dependent epimerase/dehydratase family protein [Agrococcus sp. TSP3-2-1]|uniref:NAD-dependent epimerase/dehydratase family protein n=1 Tax=Agrococcus sp. TSP3-2-1 TaxID=2804583 RepID=UPI003CEF96F9
MRVLVIGGAGFLGSYVLRELQDAGSTVCVFDQQTPAAPAANATYVTGDVRNAGDMAQCFTDFRPDVVVHMAAIVNPRVLREQPILAYEVNTTSVVTALDLAVKSGASRFVYVSSISAVAPSPSEPIGADAPLVNSQGGSTLAFYGTSKAAAECWVMGFREVFNLDVRIVRPSAVYGPGMQYGMGIRDMVEGAVAGDPVSLTEGTRVRRDYTHVADVASLVERCAHVDLAPDDVRIFYGATGRLPVDQFALRDVLLEVMPEADIMLADVITDLEAQENSFRGVLDIVPARELLGWEPQRRELRDGVASYIAAASGRAAS